MTTSKRIFAAVLALMMLAGLCLTICARADGPLRAIVTHPPGAVGAGDQVEITVELFDGAPPYTVTLWYTIFEGGAEYPFTETIEDNTGGVQFLIPVEFGEHMGYSLQVTDTGGEIFHPPGGNVVFVGTPPPAPLKILSARVDAEYFPPSGVANLLLEVEGGTPRYLVKVAQHAYRFGNIPIKKVWEDSGYWTTRYIEYAIWLPEDLPILYPEADYLMLRGTIEDDMGRTAELPEGLEVDIYYPLDGTCSLDKERLLPGKPLTATVNVSGGKPPYSCQFNWGWGDADGSQRVTRTLTGDGPQFRDSFQLDYGAATPPVDAIGGWSAVVRDSGMGRTKLSTYVGFLVGAPGDVYGDGKLDLRDLALMMDHALGEVPDVEQSDNADMNNDNWCGIDDVQLLINLLVK